MRSEDTASERLAQAIEERSLWDAEMALRELEHQPSLEDALGYLDLLAEQRPDKLELACVRWHGRLETEASFLSLADSQLALTALESLCLGEPHGITMLRRLLGQVKPDPRSLREQPAR
jgi:hypothetical protein